MACLLLSLADSYENVLAIYNSYFQSYYVTKKIIRDQVEKIERLKLELYREPSFSYEKSRLLGHITKF